jgi:hypothetical protein
MLPTQNILIMKKQVIILFLLLICISSYSQRFFVRKTTTPCTDAMIDTLVGKWINPPNNLEKEMNKAEAQEVAKRLNAIQQLVKQAYPTPTGADAGWGGGLFNTSFANQVKYTKYQDERMDEEIVKSNPVSHLQYNLILYPYYCDYSTPNGLFNIFPEISGSTGITIHANELSILTGNVLQEEGMTIDGRPIKYKMPIMGKCKEYDMMTPEGGANATLFSKRYVLISRNGMLPYIPVTRKQYLDRAITYATKFYDKLIASTSLITDKTEKDNYIKINKNAKNNALKKYQDEIEITTKEGLLDSPAIISNSQDLIINYQAPIFSTEAEGGRMLVTENPTYFRKDLPKYVPQFFVLEWGWSTGAWSARFRKAIEENFQTGNLKEMIDK